MQMDERGARVREVRRRLVQDRPPRTRPRERDFETVAMPERDCDLLRDLLISERVETVVEVGLAYASSALAVGEALVTVSPPNPRHIIIDPFQDHAYADIGWDLLRAAGLDSIARLMRTSSSIALPAKRGGAAGSRCRLLVLGETRRSRRVALPPHES
jgi:hypothetical protein